MNWLFKPATPTQITHFKRLWLYLLAFVVGIFLIAPTLIVIPMSFSASDYLEFPPRELSLRWYESYFNSDQWMRSTWISLRVGLMTMFFATIIGTAAAYGLWAGRVFGRVVIMGLFALPMAVPIILLGVGSLFVLAKLGLVNTLFGLTVMHTALALPFVMIVVSAGLSAFDASQEQAARSLGASRTYAFITVVLPQIKFSVISAMLFSFFASFDEVVVAMFISTGNGATLNRRMFNALRDQVDPTIAAISTCLIFVSIILIVLGQIFRPRQP